MINQVNILVITGSRNPNGQTASTTKAVANGIKSAGGNVEELFLPKLGIERCRQCDDSGWGICRSDGICIINDDFAWIVEKIKSSDAVVFATPVYFSDLSESLKAFLDRLRRICVNDAGRINIDGKPAIGLCVAGGGGGGAPACSVILERSLATCGFAVIDLIPARRQNLVHKIEIMELTGKWLVEQVSK